jgi:hypothetical protein
MHVVHFEHIAEQRGPREAIGFGTAGDGRHVGLARAGHAAEPVEQVKPRFCPDNFIGRTLQMLCKPLG